MAMDLWTPENFDWDRLLFLDEEGIERSPAYRREVASDPLVFALLYFPHHLQSPETRGLMSINELHLDIANSAQYWIRQNILPMEIRECWVAPRGVGKSTWMFLIMPVWAAAYGHRRYISMFADSGTQAKQHLDNMKLEFRTNARLRKDFPNLCAPRPLAGGDNKTEYISKSGITITAHGIDASTLGAKSGSKRPDLLVFDDIEPKESSYSPELKRKRLDTLINGVFAMNPNAIVQIAGTTTMYGSIIHELVRSVISDEARELFPWIAAENIRTRYYPAIVTNPDGTERSLWPQRWAMDFLNSIRTTRNYQLNYNNNPTSSAVDVEPGSTTVGGGGFWEENDFRYDIDFDVVDMLLVLDPATTSHAGSDQSGLAIIGVDRSGQRAVVEYARGVRLRPRPLREMILEILAYNPLISTLLVETNQGGDYIVENLSPLPRGIQVITQHEHAPKKLRVRQMLDYDERGWVRYRSRFPALHEQQLIFPNGLHDDIVDATAKGVHHVLRHRMAELTGGR